MRLAEFALFETALLLDHVDERFLKNEPVDILRSRQLVGVRCAADGVKEELILQGVLWLLCHWSPVRVCPLFDLLSSCGGSSPFAADARLEGLEEGQLRRGSLRFGSHLFAEMISLQVWCW